MKSAYELAMERLNKSDPQTAQPLSDSQKGRLAEIESLYKSKIAEREIFLSGKLAEAQRGGDRLAVDQIRQQIASERVRLEEERDSKKQAVRSGKE